MNKEKALQGIEALIQDGNNVLKTMRNSELGGTYVDSAQDIRMNVFEAVKNLVSMGKNLS